MAMYDDETLLKAHQVFPLVMASFSRRLRPPSYAGRLERTFRGYLKDRPADEVYTTILAIGGLRQVERFWETKDYNDRRAAVDSWYGFLTREPIESSSKSKMSLITGLSRKKHIVASEAAVTECVPGHDVASCNEWYCVKPTCTDARKHHQTSNNLVFHSSLAAGPPMRPIPRDHLRLLLSDLPALTDIWLPTGEAVILERNIVESPSQIKRNTQVLLDLIKEDPGSIEDEWNPGMSQLTRRNSMHSYTGVEFSGGAQHH